MRVFFLYSALILYSSFSSPTPDVISIIDYIIIGLLILSTGFISSFNFLTVSQDNSLINYLRFFILIIFPYPILIGALNGHSLTDVIRDTAPLLCLFIPICLHKQNLKYFDILLGLAGGLFALRYIISFIPSMPFPSSDLLYLANSPLVSFAAILGFGIFIDKQRILWTKRFFGLVISMIAFAAMASMLQRAPLGLSLLACIGIYILRLSHHPIQTVFQGIVLFIPIYAISPIIFDIFGNITQKTILVGANNRTEEFLAIIHQITILGHGWGAQWQSPAVGDVWVRYTHNMMSYYILKTGIIGGFLAFILFIGLIKKTFLLIKKDAVTGFALFVPFIIHGMLYTGYKTLDFSLLITLLISWQHNDRFYSLTEHSRPLLVRRVV